MCSPPSCWAESQSSLKKPEEEREHFEKTQHFWGWLFPMLQTVLNTVSVGWIRKLWNTVHKLSAKWGTERWQGHRDIPSDIAVIENTFGSQFICTSFVSKSLISSGPGIQMNSLKKFLFLNVKARIFQQKLLDGKTMSEPPDFLKKKIKLKMYVAKGLSWDFFRLRLERKEQE